MNLYTCAGCNSTKHAEAFDAADVEAHVKNPQRKNLLCLECGEQGRTLRDVKLYSCRLCARKLGRLKFGKEDMKHFQRSSQKSMRCTACKFAAALNDKRSDE